MSNVTQNYNVEMSS